MQTRIHYIEQTTSTNDNARDARYREGDVIWAEHQTAGRGQRGHTWESGQGLNLTFTVVLEPTFLPAAEQFLLTEVVTLALTDTFNAYGIDTRIKWTNDIYAGDRKLVGILIEHNLAGTHLARTVVGIGININQTEFDPALPNPISMHVASGHEFDRREVLECLCTHLGARYELLRAGEKQALQQAYRERMYALEQMRTFRHPDGRPTQAAIQGVKPSGELILLHADGTQQEYLFKEIEFVLKK